MVASVTGGGANNCADRRDGTLAWTGCPLLLLLNALLKNRFRLRDTGAHPFRKERGKEWGTLVEGLEESKGSLTTEHPRPIEA